MINLDPCFEGMTYFQGTVGDLAQTCQNEAGLRYKVVLNRVAQCQEPISSLTSYSALGI